MKKKDRIYWINSGWYPVNIGFCPSEKAFWKYIKAHNVENGEYPESGGMVTSFLDDRGKCCLVTVSDGLEDRISATALVGVIVHEATHVWQQICKHIGESFPAYEQEAYAIQSISINLLAAWEATRGKK